METCSTAKFLSVLGAMLINLGGRMRLFWGNLSIYTMSYLVYRGRQGPSVQISWFGFVYSISWLSAMFTSDRIARAIGVRATVLLGIGVFNSFFFFAIFSAGTSWAVFSFLFSPLLGSGIGFFEGTVLNHYVLEWADPDSSLLTSLYLASSVVGAGIINQVVTRFLNPDNLVPSLHESGIKLFYQDDVLDNVPYLYLLLGGVLLALQLVGFVLLRKQPNKGETIPLSTSASGWIRKRENNYGTPSGNEPETETGKDDDRGENEITNSKLSPSLRKIMTNGRSVACSDGACENIPIEVEQDARVGNGSNSHKETRNSKQAEDGAQKVFDLIFSKKFIKLWASYLCLSHFNMFIFSYYKAYAELYIEDDEFLAQVGSSLAFTGIISLSLWSLVLDRVGLKLSMMAICVICYVLSFLIYFAAMLDKWAYFLAILLGDAVGNCSYLGFISAVIVVFGRKQLSRNIALLLTANMITNFLISSLAEILIAHFGYFYLFLWISLMSTVSLLIFAFVEF